MPDNFHLKPVLVDEALAEMAGHVSNLHDSYVNEKPTNIHFRLDRLVHLAQALHTDVLRFEEAGTPMAHPDYECLFTTPEYLSWKMSDYHIPVGDEGGS